MATLEITMPIETQWPSQEDLAARNRIEDDLEEAKIGSIIGAGGGRGAMDLSLRLSDSKSIEAMKAAVEGIVRAHLPACRYKIIVIE